MGPLFCGKHGETETSRLPVAAWGSWNTRSFAASTVHPDRYVRRVSVVLPCTAIELLQNFDDAQTFHPKHAKAVL